MKELSAKLEVILKPLLAIIIVVILGAVLANNLWARISKARSSVTSETKTLNLLNDKLSLLERSSQAQQIQSYSSAVTSALPLNSPTLQLISHIRSKELEHNVVIESISGGSTLTKEGFNSVGITFKAIGSSFDLANFLISLSNVSPISKFQQISFEQESSGQLTMDAQIETYWSDTPTQLPRLDEPISDLTDAEKSIIDEVTRLQKPAFTLLQPDDTNTPERDPFIQI